VSQFEPGGFLELARNLWGCDDSDPLFEASQRSAVSRAYYSAFLVADAKQTRRTSKHEDLFRHYETHKDRKLISVGQRLRSLYAARCRANYGDLVSDPAWEAEVAVEEAEDLRKIIAEWSGTI